MLAGTSVGAVNACYLATRADAPERQGRDLCERWKGLHLDDVLRLGATDVARIAFDLLRRTPAHASRGRRIGLVDPRGLQEIASRHVVWRQIGQCIERGTLEALALAATHVASGRTTVFIQRHKPLTDFPARPSPHYRAVATRVGLKHAMASAAIPLLFPPVTVAGELYVDGGLRQNVPLSPAIRLGADRVIVLPLRHEASAVVGLPREGPAQEPRERALPSGAFLLGKALDTLLNDRVDEDLDRLRQTNALLEAGTRSYGPPFSMLLNAALEAAHGHSLRYVRHLVVRPSVDLGKLAAEFVTTKEFAKRAKGFEGKLVRRLAESEAPDQADLASYLLFDGAFASLLIELGRKDAAAKREDWLRFCSSEPENHVEAAQRELPRATGA
ncbi:MAG: patatin-like phospholipase family protein [Myxococcales bacterium]